MKEIDILLSRRRVISLFGAGVAAVAGSLTQRRADAATNCVSTPAVTEGPYFVEENLYRSDIRVDPSDGSTRPGVPLTLQISVSEVTNSACGPLTGAHIEVWHCDAAGIYSDEQANSSRGKKFLRGYQITDENGVVNFTTVYPGWYSGRAVHIHFKVRTYSGATKIDEFTSQWFFDESVTDTVHAQSPYNTRGTRDTRNSNDSVLRPTANPDRLMLNLTKTDNGYAATVNVGVDLKTPAVSSAVITSNGVVNAASYQPGVSPGAWITILGQNLASTTHALTTSDLVNGVMPTTLGGASVNINGKPAFLQYVSPTQINVQAPSDSNVGNVQVTVTNAAGTSAPVTANLQPMLPAFFTSQNYVAAVRSDGTVITGVASTASGTAQSVKPGEVVSLYGTGFGPTNPAVAPGQAIQTAEPLANPVTITIGGVMAPLSFAGLTGTGLNQFNVTVPNVSSGDQPVSAQIAGLTTQSGVLLKVG